MVRLPKIKIGVQTRKNHFDLSHDVNTTSDFGFCQPTIIRHLNAGSSSKLNTSIGVRLAPLPCPTFGRIKLKTYNVFVPIQEVYEAFDYMQKKTSVASAFGSYVPSEAPYIRAFNFWNSIVGISLKNWCEMFNYTAGDDYGKLKTNHDDNIFMNFSLCAPSFLWSNWKKDEPYISDVDGKLHARMHPVDGTMVPCGSFISDRNGLWDEVGSNYHFRALYDGFLRQLGSESVILQDEFTLDLGQLYKIPVNYEEVGIFQDRMNGPFIPQAIFPNFANKELFIDALTGSQDYRLDAIRKAYYTNRSNFNDSDFVFGNSSVTVSITPTQYGGEEGVDPILDMVIPYALCGNWTKRGQRLFKVINAIGLRGFVYNDVVDLCKLFAYYKAWFDIMNPGRSIQWKETSAYRLIHSYYDLNEQIQGLVTDNDDSYPYHNEEAFSDWEQFLVDVSNCCYVLPVDNITAATPLPIEQVGSMGDDKLFPYDNVRGSVVHSGDEDKVYPYIDGSADINGLAVQALLKLYKLSNKNSVIGSRIEDYLRTKFGYTIEHSNILQGSEQTVKIEEIFANAGTSENYLGEIGGRGSTNNAYTSSIKFDCDKFGIFVQFVCIVPYGDYVQGNIKAKVNRNDFYQEVYDSLGKEALSMSEILARSNDITYRPNMQSYGFVPMCWRDKVQNSMHNGGFALKSQRETLLPYSLDRLFNEHVKRAKSSYRTVGNNFQDVEFVEDAPSVITPSEEMRYIGRTPDYGSYDRIFFDNTGYFDNFILHVVEDWDYYANMKPISESFDTFDTDNDDSTKTITAS